MIWLYNLIIIIIQLVDSELIDLFVDEISYNLPNLSACAKWNLNGTTFTDKPVGTFDAYALFVDTKNNLYMSNPANRDIYKWPNMSNTFSRIILDYWIKPYGLFLLKSGDIYISSSEDGRVYRWVETTKTIEMVVQFCTICTSIFISIRDVVYCSITSYNQIGTKSLHNNSDLMTIVAGVGFPGSAANMLRSPRGIFVATNFDLYVADYSNNRIQLFHPGEINAITVAGTLNTIELRYPISVVLDANNYIYIVDNGNHRIVASTPYGLRCIVSCTESGSSSSKLNNPRSMAFDSFGNVYVTDSFNYRIQKFSLSNNSCDTNGRKINTTLTSTLSITTLYESMYESIVTRNSPMYSRYCEDGYFYENIQIIVSKQGNYDIFINSTNQLYITLHKNYFDPAESSTNLIFHQTDWCNVSQIKFISHFHAGITYNLIISTAYPNMTSSFSVALIGPSHININRTNISKLVQFTYTSMLTSNSHRCNHQNQILFSYYCEIIEVSIIETGTYTIINNSTMILHGYVYENNNFTLLALSMNAIVKRNSGNCDSQFKISFDRQVNTSFILIVTTNHGYEQGNFSIIVNGPNNVTMKRKDDIPKIIQSNYSSELTNNSQKHNHLNCERLDYYYEAFQININTTGYYLLSSSSDFNTYVYLYKDYFDPYDPQKTLLSSDGTYSNVEKFHITDQLQSNITYVLMVTTSPNHKNLQGVFTVIIHGPDQVSIEKIDNYLPIEQSVYELQLTKYSHKYRCDNNHLPMNHHYAVIQILVIQSGTYSLSNANNDCADGILYTQHFNPHSPSKSLLPDDENRCDFCQFKIISHLQSNSTYILVVEALLDTDITNIRLLVSGPNKVSIYHISLRAIYSSQLTTDHQVYPRICGTGNYHYETIQINVQLSGSYTFDSSNNSILLYGYLYENNFDPTYPMKNLIIESNYSCNNPFKLGSYLETNRIYILVVTTFISNVKGSFTILVTGPHNLTLNKIITKHSSCVVGDQCSLFTKSIGLTIDDILRNQVQPNTSFGQQSSLIHGATIITMVMFFIGLINGIFSFITFRNKELRKMGCGIYLLASSITSLLTITMFTIKFWFAILTQLYSTVDSTVLRVDCVFIGPVLKLCLYLDGWLNACVAIERTVNVLKGVNFDKRMSRRMARRMIFILPILILGSLVHEPICHDLFEYTIPKFKPIDGNSTVDVPIEIEDDPSFEITEEYHVLCVIRYSRSLQNYNTITLFFHLIVPFIANLCSALLIIFGTARRRSVARNEQSFKEHVLKQLSEHKQLLISPVVLLVLAMPRIILSLISGCVDPSSNPWLYLCGYFISYTPPMLIFALFVFPSKHYMKTFRESITRRQGRRQGIDQ